MRYTVDAGRQILRDGVRVATVYSKVQTNQEGGLAPADADQFTHEVTRILNTWPVMLSALEWIAEHGDTGEGGRPAYHAMRTKAREAIAAAKDNRPQWKEE